MKTKINTKLLFVLLLIAISYYGFIAYYYSYYSLEIFLIPMVLLLAALGAIIVGFISSLNLIKRFQLFSGIAIFLFLVLIIEHYVSSYKPIKRMNIPDEYSGLVHVFTAKASDSDDFYADTNGMLYFYADREVDVQILHGSVDISNANNEYGSFNLEFYSEDSTLLKSANGYCFRAEKDRKYPDSPWNQFHESCLPNNELSALVARGIIDTSQIEFYYYKD